MPENAKLNKTTSKRTKKNQKNRTKLKNCPLCQNSAVIKKGFRSDLFYARCSQNCCVTKYYESEEEAANAWNERKINLSAEEKIRISKIRPYRRSALCSNGGM